MHFEVPAGTPRSGAEPALELRGISKVFQGQRALDDFSLTVQAGEIHAIVGHNGSGKSTFIKILAGFHQPEDGAEGRIHGAPLQLGSPTSARDGGLRFIHQDLGLIGEESILDNLALGSGYQGRWWLSDRAERRAAAALLDEFGIEASPDALVSSLTPARQAMVAIARALKDGATDRMILVLDEPTATLPAHEVEHLFALVRALKAKGGTIIYVSHRLGEILQLADRVTVLREGREVASRPVAGLTEDDLIRLIVGRELEAYYPPPPPAAKEVVLSVSGLDGTIVRDVDLELHRGEIMGVTGLVGSGQEELLDLVFGAERRTGGSVSIAGAEPRGPKASIRAGVMFAAADRRTRSGIPEWTVRENLTLPRLPRSRRMAWMSVSSERAEAARWLDRLDVLPRDPERPFASLSGGNQQKVVLARLLRCEPAVLLLEEPTSGVDVGARHGIYSALSAAAADGAAILMSSTDAEELAAVCDRVAVFRDGRIVATLEAESLTVDQLTSTTVREDAAGVSPERS